MKDIVAKSFIFPNTEYVMNVIIIWWSHHDSKKDPYYKIMYNTVEMVRRCTQREIVFKKVIMEYQ